MVDTASGIVEGKVLDIIAVCSKWVGWALLVADGEWHFNLVMVLWLSWTGLQGRSWLSSPTGRFKRPRAILTLPGPPSQLATMAHRCHYAAGMQWIRHKRDRKCGDPPGRPVSDHFGRCTSLIAVLLWREEERTKIMREAVGTHGLNVWREARLIFLTKLNSVNRLRRQ